MISEGQGTRALLFSVLIQLLVSCLALQEPVVLIPGDGATQLEAKLNKTSRAHRICQLQSDWFGIWLNIHLLAPVAFDCLSDNLKLRFNDSTRKTENTDGVQLRVRNFGSVESVEYLDQMKISKTDYFANIVSTLVEQHNYTRDVDIFGAGYDFRKAPNELVDYFSNLTQLIEWIVNKRGQSVTLICHSMGCLNSLYLLNSKTQDWRQRHVRRLISLAAPWDGSFKALSTMLFGDNLGVPLLNSVKLQALQATFPSLMYLFPREPTYDRTRVLIETPLFNYTLDNLAQFFLDSNLVSQLEMWHDTQRIAADLQAPQVELWCLHGAGFKTASKIVYEDDETQEYHLEYDDGDGSVNLDSLRACNRFKSQQEQPVNRLELAGVSHIGILRGQEAANFISTNIMSRTDVSSS